MKYSFIVQYFRHRDNIINITNSLINIPDSELIFHNDSNSDLDIFNELLNKYSNLKVICSNDIHEIRGYNKCIQCANGEYIWICQDDDIMNCNNILRKIDILFKNYNDLGIISLNNGGLENWGLQENKFNKIMNNDLKTDIKIDNTNINYMFVSWANIGPFIIKKTILDKIGTFDEFYSDIGELGIGYDSEFTFRANLNNIRVILLRFDDIERGVGGHGTKASNKKRNERKIRCRKNRELFNNQYNNYTEIIKNIVNELNNKL